jgi:hypothetical protein
MNNLDVVCAHADTGPSGCDLPARRQDAHAIDASRPETGSDDPAMQSEAGSFWSSFEQELACWREESIAATFWWRDDDATAASPALARLLDISSGEGGPVAIAAIPDVLCPSLPAMLKGHGAVRVLQHGFAHCNHAAGLGEGAWELGRHRRGDEVLEQLNAGREILRAAFGDQFIPVVVPPWNRIDRGLFPGLLQTGFIGVSAFGERAATAPCLIEAHAQFDLLAWKGTPRFHGEAAAQSEIVGHLRRRRLGIVDCDEATGILSHHLSLDEPAWRFLADFVGHVARHRAARWLSAGELFGIPGGHESR